jgi:thioredoxin-related protein
MKIILTCIAVSFFILGYSDAQEEKKIVKMTIPKPVDKTLKIAGLEWYTDVELGFYIAKKEHKNVIVMVGEDSCRWCKKMKENTLSDPKIQEALQQYILISIKRSDKESVKYVPEFDGNIPSFFFMTEKENMIEPVVGYFNADDFLTYIKEIEEG